MRGTTLSRVAQERPASEKARLRTDNGLFDSTLVDE
jgi:hypothetical protein